MTGVHDGSAESESEPRVVCRFSCGAASAVATKLAIAKYGIDRVVITYSDTGSEHPDNLRFRADCERWFGKQVQVFKSDRFKDTWHVWEKERFITSKRGAPCTGALKREPHFAFERPTDIMVFGYTADKPDQVRAANLRKQNFERAIETPLIDASLTKADCLAMIARAGIELPAMYKLGFQNNNCIGCPKGGMGYWNMIRKHFPEQFERMAALQRHLGPGSFFFREKDETRFGLDGLHPDRGDIRTEPNIECSVMCHTAELEIAEAAE
ncbi:phosphoadenosine phosphosulfate reductase family protein [Bradyrhizobium sp. CCH5-F6]|jgi:3'-phosphoadenosine 5'-phosphosulfate sulfotransferase (PAPS reductase)/FAD synthetase|uniref:phosphoadenosine phosphosulfate reductase domain-containing protein n=1 Tax=Bradyrhizobium sp. CCH5-F6 TaxID=1768753 RepID=UPI00076A0C30|nr:phosphoadenosine phosphosulfate reductase family protein [Bradyrhizobium sp. CCH5-F6]